MVRTERSCRLHNLDFGIARRALFEASKHSVIQCHLQTILHHFYPYAVAIRDIRWILSYRSCKVEWWKNVSNHKQIMYFLQPKVCLLWRTTVSCDIIQDAGSKTSEFLGPYPACWDKRYNNPPPKISKLPIVFLNLLQGFSWNC